MLRFKVVGICLVKNELALQFKDRIIYFKPQRPAFLWQLGDVVYVVNKGGPNE